MGFWNRSHEPVGNFNFRIEIEGVTTASFTAMEGLSSETEVITYGGSVDQIQRKRPGRHKWTDVTLKRGQVLSEELWRWRQTVIDGHVERKSGSIIVCDDQGEELRRYNFFEAWPTKYQGMKLDGQGKENLLEELTITMERVEVG